MSSRSNIMVQTITILCDFCQNPTSSSEDGWDFALKNKPLNPELQSDDLGLFITASTGVNVLDICRICLKETLADIIKHL